MGEFINDDAVLTIDSNDFSDHLTSSQLSSNFTTEQKTAMGSVAHSFLGGLITGSLSIELNDDLAVGSIDEILWDAHVARLEVPFTYKQTSAAISTSNPEWQGFILINDYKVGGSIGTLGKKTLTLQVNGLPVRDVTP